MVTRHLPTGLIATTRASVSPQLDDLIACCGWPLLLEASPRLLGRELSQHNPECVLFWLEDRQGIASMARLVAWSRERGARPYRVAVAMLLDAGLEAALRTAGAHSFLAIADWSAADVIDALWPLLQQSARPAAEIAAGAKRWIKPGHRVGTAVTRSDLVRPP
jgi:hypothetical protein